MSQRELAVTRGCALISFSSPAVPVCMVVPRRAQAEGLGSLIEPDLLRADAVVAEKDLDKVKAILVQYAGEEGVGEGAEERGEQRACGVTAERQSGKQK